MSSKIQTPYPSFTDIDGHPLDSGFIYVGEAGKNPEVYPIPVFWDEDLTIPAEQPIRTRNGYLSYFGRAGKIYVDGEECSVNVRNKRSDLIYTDLHADLSFTQTNANERFKYTIQTLDSFDALRNFKPSMNGQVVQIKSHTAGKQKGGGIFIYDESSVLVDNNGTIAKSLVANGAFIRQYDTREGYFEWFGALLDGTTNDYAAIVAALKVLKNIHLSGRIRSLSPIDIDQFQVGQTLGITITGDGTESSYFDFVGCAQGFYSSSNSFFRDFFLDNLQINNVDNNQTGIGIYIGSGGAEQINISSVTYRGWLLGRATHSWNSSYKNEVFRVCKYPFSMYGTSANVTNPYAHTCTSPYMIGYQSDSSGVLTLPSVPHAYSAMSGFAADNCGADGSVYKFGNCSGLVFDAISAERCQGTHIFDFTDIVGTSYSSTVFESFTMYVNSLNPNIVGLMKKPSTPLGNVIFNDLKISTDKEIYVVSGDGSGITLNNPQLNNRAFSRLVENAAVGAKVNGVAIGADSRENGEIGLSISANAITYIRVKSRKGKALIDPTTQRLVLYCGSLSEALAQGNMMGAVITALPINKSGNNTNEKAGQLFISSAMDYNAGDMTGHLKVVRTGTLTTATTVTRNTGNTTVLQFDIIFEVSVATTRYLLDIDLTFNGISNVNGLAWQVIAK